MSSEVFYSSRNASTNTDTVYNNSAIRELVHHFLKEFFEDHYNGAPRALWYVRFIQFVNHGPLWSCSATTIGNHHDRAECTQRDTESRLESSVKLFSSLTYGQMSKVTYSVNMPGPFTGVESFYEKYSI